MAARVGKSDWGSGVDVLAAGAATPRVVGSNHRPGPGITYSPSRARNRLSIPLQAQICSRQKPQVANICVRLAKPRNRQDSARGWRRSLGDELQKGEEQPSDP